MQLVKTLALGAALSSLLVAGACGTRPGDRALSGAGIGAASGAAIGAMTGGSVATGAAVGAAGGAIIGAATDPCDLDLGDPWWDQHGGRDEYERRCN